MKEADILKDLAQFVSAMQTEYNRYVLKMMNPEVRQLFTQLRDDETRSVVRIQQKIERTYAKARIVARLLPARSKY